MNSDIKINVVNSFPTFSALFTQYTMAFSHIVYEGNIYNFVKTIKKGKGKMYVDIYFDEANFHMLEIELIGKKVSRINAFYKI